MNSKLKFTLKSITHSGAHIGRDITLKVSSSELGIDFETKKDVLPDKTTVLNKELYNFEVETSKLDIPLTVTVIERDWLFDDKGSMYQRLNIHTDIASVSEYTVTIKVYENRLFFWKKPAKFDVVFEVEITHITAPKRIPTVDDPEWTGDFRDDTDQMILARMIFGEARNELSPEILRHAVGWVARNRVENDIVWWGTTYQEVIPKDAQFSAFSVGDDNRDEVENPLKSGNDIDKQAWENCYDIAGKILDGSISDPTNGADHYYSDSIDQPGYYKGKSPTLEITDQPDQNGKKITTYFYKLH